MIIPIKDLLQRVLNPEADWRILLLNNWQTIVGSLKTRIRLEKIYSDTLIIGVYESHWMQELFLLSRVLIQAINKQLGKQYIANLKFQLICQNSVKPILKPKVAAVPCSITKASLTHEQENALLRVKDEQLRHELVRFLARCQGR